MSIRRRHTFFFSFDDPDAFEKFAFSAEDKSVKITHFSSPREDRIQIPSSLLSSDSSNTEIAALLQSVDKLQIKWSSDAPFNHNYPAAIVQESGLHVEFVPKANTPINSQSLKTLLSSFFGVEFSGEEKLVDALKWKSFYAPLDSLEQVTSSIQRAFCSNPDSPCSQQISELKHANSFSLSYGTIPDNAKPHHHESDITIEAFWSDRQSMAEQAGITESVISKIYPDEKVEIGILNIHPEYTTPLSVWGLSGFTRNLDESKTEKLLYQYTTQHRSINSNYYVDFMRPVGLHPKHKLVMSNVRAPKRQCSLYAKYSFSKSLFLDRYQLKDLAEPTPNRPAVGRLYDVWGETDLEAPIWAVDGWGSEALIQLYTSHKSSDGELVFELPTHSRYEVPQTQSSSVHEYQPWPVVFWACLPPTKEEDNSLETTVPSAVETRNIGYESIFPNDTVFYYFNADTSRLPSDRLQSEFDIPVAPFSSYSVVQVVTVVVILASFFYLLYEIIRNSLSYNKKEEKNTETKNK